MLWFYCDFLKLLIRRDFKLFRGFNVFCGEVCDYFLMCVYIMVLL